MFFSKAKITIVKSYYTKNEFCLNTKLTMVYCILGISHLVTILLPLLATEEMTQWLTQAPVNYKGMDSNSRPETTHNLNPLRL